MYCFDEKAVNELIEGYPQLKRMFRTYFVSLKVCFRVGEPPLKFWA